jgi:cytochrome c oxidase subunit 2
VVYPDQGIITANEIYIPVGEPVRIELTSEDVNHSFWVPELHGKLDMIPGRTNVFWLEAEQAGDFWGICAEFCGVQHANMLFLVIAQPADDFDTWLAAQQQAAVPPNDELTQFGHQIFIDASCDSCHAIAGTDAVGRLGPDLTHMASRRTLAAGILENNLGNLGGWIINPQHIKPGNLMPSSDLSGPELQALLAYLQSLE